MAKKTTKPSSKKEIIQATCKITNGEQKQAKMPPEITDQQYENCVLNSEGIEPLKLVQREKHTTLNTIIQKGGQLGLK